MSLKLYFAPGACSFVPHAMLEIAGVNFEPHMVKLHKGEQRTADYLALNPRGQVPVLVDEGEVITQIVAILLHLDSKLPGAHILPATGMARTHALSLLAWMNNTVHPTFTHFFMPQKFSDDEAAQKAMQRFAVDRFRECLQEIEALAAKASPWLFGSHPGAVDAYSLTLLRWGGYAGIDPTSMPATWGLAQRFAALPPVAQAVARERLELNVYKPAA
jgi:glutathione S-transferase